jgi:flagellar FliL protein
VAKAHKRADGSAKLSGATTALAFVLVTVIAAGAGAGHGLRAAKPQDHPEAAKTTQPQPHGEMKGATGDLTRELPPIVATLSEPKNVWMRLETAIVLDRAALPEADRLAREITGDVLAFVRTLSLPQLQGASGLQHLREDLNERAATRSKGRVRELIIQAMVLQ